MVYLIIDKSSTFGCVDHRSSILGSGTYLLTPYCVWYYCKLYTFTYTKISHLCMWETISYIHGAMVTTFVAVANEYSNINYTDNQILHPVLDISVGRLCRDCADVWKSREEYPNINYTDNQILHPPVLDISVNYIGIVPMFENPKESATLKLLWKLSSAWLLSTYVSLWDSEEDWVLKLASSVFLVKLFGVCLSIPYCTCQQTWSPSW